MEKNLRLETWFQDWKEKQRIGFQYGSNIGFQLLETMNFDCKQSSKVGNSESRDWKHKYMMGNKLNRKHKKLIGKINIVLV